MIDLERPVRADGALAQFDAPRSVVERADVAIIGGGPAGAATALRLAQRGLRVVLLERRTFLQPHNDALRSGEGLIPATLRQLAELGLSVAAPAWALDTIGHVRMVWPNGCATNNDIRARGGIVQVDRELLDHALFAAASRAGADCREGWRVRSLERDAAGRVVGVVALAPHADQPQLIRAPLVVDAGGRTALALRGAAAPEATDQSVAVCMYFRHVGGLDPHVWEMHLLDGRQLLVFQLSQLRAGLVRCGMGVTGAALGQAPCRPADLFWESVRAAPQLARRLDPEALLGRPFVRARIGYRVRQVAFDGLLLVGDAAGYVNPLFGDGILRALRMAQRAAATIGGAFGSRDVSRAGLAPYARYHAACDQRDQALRWSLRRLERAPHMLNAVGRAGLLRRALFGALLS